MFTYRRSTASAMRPNSSTSFGRRRSITVRMPSPANAPASSVLSFVSESERYSRLCRTRRPSAADAPPTSRKLSRDGIIGAYAYPATRPLYRARICRGKHGKNGWCPAPGAEFGLAAALLIGRALPSMWTRLPSSGRMCQTTWRDIGLRPRDYRLAHAARSTCVRRPPAILRGVFCFGSTAFDGPSCARVARRRAASGRNRSMTVKVFDTTLRDGAQREGITYSVADKLAVARLLDEFGVAFIEGGWPGAMPKDTEFFARARTELDLRHATLVAFGATRKVGVDVARDPQVRALLEA